MACKYCQNQEHFETKDNFPYITQIVDGMLVVSKCKRFFKTRTTVLYGNDIKYCPMCGEDLIKVKSIGNKHIVE